MRKHPLSLKFCKSNPLSGSVQFCVTEADAEVNYFPAVQCISEEFSETQYLFSENRIKSELSVKLV